MKWKVTEQPTFEPLTLSEVKAVRRYDDQVDDDPFLHSLITTARQWCENHMEKAVVDQEITVKLDSFPDDPRVKLPRAGMTAVTSVKYLDQDGAEQTLSTDVYAPDTFSEPSAIYRKANQEWPETEDQQNAVTIVYRSGASDADGVDRTIKQAMHLLIGHWDANREAVVTGTIATEIQMTVEALLGQQRVMGV